MTDKAAHSENCVCRVVLAEDTFTAYARCQRLLGEGVILYHVRGQHELLITIADMMTEGRPADGVIVDLQLESESIDSTCQAIKVLRQRCPYLPIIIWSKQDPESSCVKRALQNGANAYVQKFSRDEAALGINMMSLIRKSRRCAD